MKKSASHQWKIFSTILVVIWLNIGCTSRRITVSSTPAGAQVKVYRHDQGVFVDLGKTPLELDHRSKKPLGEVLPLEDVGALGFRISAPGYQSEVGFIDTRRAQTINLHFQLEALQDAEDPSSDAANRVAVDLETLYGLLHEERYASAQTLLRELVKRYPKAARLWTLLGSVELLSGDTQGALQAWKQSLFLDPQQADVRMRLEQME